MSMVSVVFFWLQAVTSEKGRGYTTTTMDMKMSILRSILSDPIVVFLLPPFAFSGLNSGYITAKIILKRAHLHEGGSVAGADITIL